MQQNDLSNSILGELYQETASVCPLPDTSSMHLSSLPPHTVLEVTPSATAVTLPTHAQLAGVEYIPSHNPPRFIFYPISWDGYESPPPSAGAACSTPNIPNKLDVPTDREDSGVDVDYGEHDWSDSVFVAFYAEDAFQSIDRWRRNVIKYTGYDILCDNGL
ncbi:hypothetical protein PAXRUDRAFT_785235 [Paxillus rubicundulus Ve08.2h10]|uniref:Uncharacterized protein n=1 Tax=Paxillus rubicundulus Ve08.2h10 TaxID=930991 RepID=A0A0D0E7H3_9AGAM|nr:hypothetical protein PAXRUDRAFT_785235 [Paxillus rubicundulus Ve08.2h10]